MAETDPLTDVHNRLGMMRDLDREWQRSIRTGQPCCVALIDLDHFKCINDTHGHLAGDKVLSIAGRFFMRRLRPYDRVYRYGGEEFLFVLPNTDLAMAERVLNRLRSLMARVPVRLMDGCVLRVTASIGITEMSSPDDSPTVVLARADRAVYAAKNAGRNRVCVDSALAEPGGTASPQATVEVEDLPDLPAGLLPPSDLPHLHR
jgi:diguanylate cyclase